MTDPNSPAAICERRNREERTNGYNRWHVLEIPVQAHDLEWAAGFPSERDLDRELRDLGAVILGLDRDGYQALAALVALKLDMIEAQQ